MNDFPKVHNTLMMNTLHGQVIVIPDNVLRDIERRDPAWMDKVPKKMKKIISEKFLVDNQEEDSEKLLETMNRKKNRKDIFSATILTTTRCNLECVYCYQGGVFDSSCDMNSETTGKVVQWITNKVSNLKPKTLMIHLYGGEPLLNYKAIKETVPPLREYCQHNGIGFSLFMTTNGSLLTPSRAKELKAYGLSIAQISLDGPPEVHDVRRPFKSSRKGTFQLILKNIREIVDFVQVDVRVNLDYHNYESIPKLMDILVSEGLNKHPNFIFNIEIVSPIPNPNSHSTKYTFQSDEEMTKIVWLWEEQMKRGFPVRGHMPTEGACENMVKNCLTIDPVGNIYKCPGFVGQKEFMIGHIDSNQFYDKFQKLSELRPWKNCLDCRYAPLCQGGCRLCAYSKNGKYDSIYCKRKFFDSCFPVFLKCKYGHRAIRRE